VGGAPREQAKKEGKVASPHPQFLEKELKITLKVLKSNLFILLHFSGPGFPSVICLKLHRWTLTGIESKKSSVSP